MNKEVSISFKISNEEKNDFLTSKDSELKLVSCNNHFVSAVYKYKLSTITFYKNSTCLVQGKDATQTVERFFKSKCLTNEQKYQVVLNYQTKNIIGSDEVGVGDYFGGLVVCAVYLPHHLESFVLSLGVRDSKKLSDEKIVQIAQSLITCLAYEVKIFSPEQYNSYYEKYQNTHVLKSILHYQAINTLWSKTIATKSVVDEIIIDEYAPKKNFILYLKIANFNKLDFLNLLSFHEHAEDKYLAVACASIIARYYFLKQIKHLSEEVNFLVPLGAWNAKVESAAKQLIHNTQNPKQKLAKFVKLHFTNTTKILG